MGNRICSADRKAIFLYNLHNMCYESLAFIILDFQTTHLRLGHVCMYVYIYFIMRVESGAVILLRV